jgi:hypothetical protein
MILNRPRQQKAVNDTAKDSCHFSEMRNFIFAKPAEMNRRLNVCGLVYL